MHQRGQGSQSQKKDEASTSHDEKVTDVPDEEKEYYWRQPGTKVLSASRLKKIDNQKKRPGQLYRPSRSSEMTKKRNRKYRTAS